MCVLLLEFLTGCSVLISVEETNGLIRKGMNAKHLLLRTTNFLKCSILSAGKFDEMR